MREGDWIMSKKKNCGIYAIINNINGKIYIGSSKNLSSRKEWHFSRLKNNSHCNDYIQRAWNKYGEKNFEFKIIIYCKEEQLLNLEQKYFYKYNSTNPNWGYNIALGAGKGPDVTGLKHTEKQNKEKSKRMKESNRKNPEYIIKRAEALSKHYENPENRERQRQISLRLGLKPPNEKGYKHTVETKKKLRESKLGEKNPQFGKPSWNKGMKMSEEYKKKLSEAHMGQVPWNKGQIGLTSHTNEWKKQQSERSKKFYEDPGQRRKQSKKMKEVCKRPEVRVRKSMAMKRRHSKNRLKKKLKLQIIINFFDSENIFPFFSQYSPIFSIMMVNMIK